MNGNGIRKSNPTFLYPPLFKILKLMKYLFISLLIIFLFTGCKQNETLPDLKEITGQTMGTFFTVKIISSNVDERQFEKIENDINSLLNEVNRQMSTYIPDSEISEFNKFNKTEWFPVSKDFFSVVEKALEVSRLTNGAFDITVGPLVNLWGFGPENKSFKIPDKNKLLDALSKTGFSKIKLDEKTSSLIKENENIYIDLSAIAKGFGVDKVAEYLVENNFRDFMVEIGGEVKTSGKNQKGEHWKIGIKSPNSASNIQKVISISNMAVATSGDYLNYFEENGVRYSHTIDPRTGLPVTHNLASVTVIHSSCILADAFATAIEVLGPDAGYTFALENKLPVYLIVREKNNFIEKQTELFKNYTD